MARVSIVVAARNEQLHVAACIAALQAQTVPVEIIVVDGSEDGTADIARSMGVTVIDNPERVTPVAFNRGIEAASGEYVGIMSAHAEPEPDYVERCLQALEGTGAWSVGGRIIRAAETPWQTAIAIAQGSRFGVGDAAHNYATVARPVESVFPGMWPCWVFDRIGMFDPGQLRSQDAELHYRIRQAGGLVWYDPAIRVRYQSRSSLAGLWRQYHDYGRWKVRLFRKHPRALRWRHAVPAAWVLSLVLPTRWLSVPAYGLLIAWASRGRWRVAAALATMHLAYGLGTWRGLLTGRATESRSGQ